MSVFPSLVGDGAMLIPQQAKQTYSRGILCICQGGCASEITVPTLSSSKNLRLQRTLDFQI